jgi:hypothetical protein
MSIEQDTIKYDSKNNFIVMKTRGYARTDKMREDFSHILELSEMENCNNVLIDATKTTNLPDIWNLHSVGLFMSKKANKLSEIRIAFAISDEISHNWRFLDDILTDRLVHFQTFKNVDDAEEWLLNK